MKAERPGSWREAPGKWDGDLGPLSEFCKIIGLFVFTLSLLGGALVVTLGRSFEFGTVEYGIAGVLAGLGVLKGCFFWCVGIALKR